MEQYVGNEFSTDFRQYLCDRRHIRNPLRRIRFDLDYTRPSQNVPMMHGNCWFFPYSGFLCIENAIALGSTEGCRYFTAAFAA